MIDHRTKGEDLIGLKCRPCTPLRNGNGDGITPNTICTIVNVVRGHGITIETERCPHCGQYARIRRIHRNDLTLLDSDGGKINE